MPIDAKCDENQCNERDTWKPLTSREEYIRNAVAAEINTGTRIELEELVNEGPGSRSLDTHPRPLVTSFTGVQLIVHEVGEQQTDTTEIEELIEEIQEFHSDTPPTLHGSDRASSRGSLSQGLGLQFITWDNSRIWKPLGILRLLLLVLLLAGLGWLCTADHQGISFLLLPYAGLIRFHIFALVLTSLFTALLLLIDVTHLTLVFAISWATLNAVVHCTTAVLLLVSSSLVVYTVVMYHCHYQSEYESTKLEYIASAVFGFVGGLASLIMGYLPCCCKKWYQPPVDVTLPNTRRLDRE